MELTGTILDVTGRKVQTKFGERDVYDIKFSDGNTYGTFKLPLADDARRAKGLADQKIRLEQNGTFWNFMGVVGVTEGLTSNGNTPQSEQEAFSRSVNTQVGSGVNQQVKERRIARMAAGKVVADLLPIMDGTAGKMVTLDDFKEKVLELEKFYLDEPEGQEWQET